MAYKKLIMPEPSRAMSRKAGIVGLGETDYFADYKAQRAKAPGYEAPSVEGLSQLAFERALADSGLRREDIDGLTVSYTFGGPPAEDMAALLGLKPRYCEINGNIMAGPLAVVCAAIARGEADTVAMVFSVASRTLGRQFGGSDEFTGEGVPPSYYYYHPWGWSSQAAHWALMFSAYQFKYGVSEEDLGAVAMQLRANARTDPNSVMQAPMSLDDYMASRYIVRPLRLFDICMVNDGAVCLIVSRHDLARDIAANKNRKAVLVAGWGELKIKHSKLDVMVNQRLRPQMQEAGRQALEMAEVKLSDIQHFECYDASSIHLVNQVEGFGFIPEGTGLDFCKAGEMAVGGTLPVNTVGGNLSNSYMQGWGHVAEIVRQMRHEAGARQIKGLEVSMSSLAQTDQVHPLVFVRG